MKHRQTHPHRIKGESTALWPTGLHKARAKELRDPNCPCLAEPRCRLPIRVVEVSRHQRFRRPPQQSAPM